MQAFHGKKWEKFNSEKVASLAYARIQGRASLVSHFQNSSLMNEDKRCRPILFQTEGPNAGDMVNILFLLFELFYKDTELLQCFPDILLHKSAFAIIYVAHCTN